MGRRIPNMIWADGRIKCVRALKRGSDTRESRARAVGDYLEAAVRADRLHPAAFAMRWQGMWDIYALERDFQAPFRRLREGLSRDAAIMLLAHMGRTRA